MIKWFALTLVITATVGILGSINPMMLLFVALFVGPIVAAAYSARRSPPAVTGFKVALACGLLTLLLVGYAAYGLVDNNTDFIYLDVWSMLITIFAIVGVPTCAGYLIGAGVGLNRRQVESAAKFRREYN